jgi:hypothetical protein
MTPDEGLRLQIEGYRRMTPQERLQVSYRLYQMACNLSRCGVRYQHPDWTELQVNQEVLRRLRLGAGIP